MSESKDKKFKQTFNKNFKQQIQETAEKMVTDKIQKQLKDKDATIFHIARQRDWMFILNIFFICVIIAGGLLLIRS